MVAVLLGTLGLVLLYVASRTVNLPFGGVHTVHNDRPQDPDLLGTAVVAGRAGHPRHRAGPAARTAAPVVDHHDDAGRGGAVGGVGHGPGVSAGPEPRPPPRPRARWPRWLLRGAGCLVVALAVLLVSGVLPVQAIRVPSDSMTPTISPGDHLLLDKRDAGRVRPSATSSSCTTRSATA